MPIVLSTVTLEPEKYPNVKIQPFKDGIVVAGLSRYKCTLFAYNDNLCCSPFIVSPFMLLLSLFLSSCYLPTFTPATPETIKHWTYFMPTAKRHTNHPPSLPWEDLTTTWFHLLPVYKPLVNRQPAETRTVKAWTEDSKEALRDCFDSAVWEELCVSNGEDIDSLTGCITDYINLCVDNTVPTRTVQCFSKSKQQT